MDAVTIFNDFVNLVDSDDLPIEAVALADGERIRRRRGISRPIGACNIYSHTKSYVSTAIGIAVEEGILSLDGKLVDAFPGIRNRPTRSRSWGASRCATC